MKKMQCPSLKIILLAAAAFFLTTDHVCAQFSRHRLQTADSLFNAKQYTQSLEHYQKILEQNQYSPSMLLKMAFIEEGLNRIGEALYHLNLYYLTTSDDKVLAKMEQLSLKHKLYGYENQDADIALAFYRQYQFYISATLAALVFFLFSVAIYLKRKKRNVLPVFVTMALFALILLAHLNFSEPDTKGIVSGSNIYLMAGPSGAAPVVDIVHSGHRLTIKGKKDVWVQVEWKGKTAYVKENFLLPVVI